VRVRSSDRHYNLYESTSQRFSQCCVPIDFHCDCIYLIIELGANLTMFCFSGLIYCSLLLASVSASVFLPSSRTVGTVPARSFHVAMSQRGNLSRFRRTTPLLTSSSSMAMVIPGYGVAEQVFVGALHRACPFTTALNDVLLLHVWKGRRPSCFVATLRVSLVFGSRHMALVFNSYLLR
jgi:hypothetical protein